MFFFLQKDIKDRLFFFPILLQIMSWVLLCAANSSYFYCAADINSLAVAIHVTFFSLVASDKLLLTILKSSRDELNSSLAYARPHWISAPSPPTLLFHFAFLYNFFYFASFQLSQLFSCWLYLWKGLGFNRKNKAKFFTAFWQSSFKIFLREILVYYGCFGLFSKIKKRSGLAFGANFLYDFSIKMFLI